LKPRDLSEPYEDQEQSNALAEGRGISWTGIALAAVCFLIVLLWATLEARYIRLWRWFNRCWSLVPFIKFVRNKQKNQPTQTKSRSADALRVDPERTP